MLTEKEELELLELENENAAMSGGGEPQGPERIESASVSSTLGTMGEIGKAIVKPAIKATVDYSKNIPSATKAMFTEPGEYFKGAAKGVGQTALNLTVNPILSGMKYVATNQWIKKNVGPITIPEPKGKAQELGSQAGSFGTIVATFALPVKKIGAPIIEGTGEGMIKASGRIQGTKVKINSPEMKKGATNEMYTKYGVFGNAQKVKDQWQNNINGLYGQVKEKISTVADDPENYASIEDVFNAAKSSAEKYGKSKTAIADIHAQLDNLKAKFDAVYPEGRINILDAQVEKQVVGKKGDWLARSGQISGNPDASVSSQAHNALYDALKTNVENKGSAGIRELNKQISEMIPMERAAAKQVLVQNRKNLIPIDDYIGALTIASSAASGNLLPAAVVGANVMSKSPTVAKALYKTGRVLKGPEAPAKPRTPKEILGGESGLLGKLSSERGSVGGGYDYIGTPAIRDPATGKIYTGDWRGHKGALTKAGDKDIEERLRYEHFLDNTNKPTENVGFIDKKGNFISRAEAEKTLQPKSSLSQMFHDEGFIGSRSEHMDAEWNRFVGKPLSPKMEAYYKEPKTIAEMRTRLENIAPAERSAMVERLKKIYGNDYAPLFGTLGIGALGTGGGLTAYEILKER